MTEISERGFEEAIERALLDRLQPGIVGARR
jgi:hypothetical protein